MKIYLHDISSNETSKITPIRHFAKTYLDSCLSILVKLYNTCGCKILTWFYFKGANKLRKFFEEKRSKVCSGPSKKSRMNYFCKNKDNVNKVL